MRFMKLQSNMPSGFVTKSLSSFITSIVMFAMNLISGALVARILHPSGRGQFALIIMVPMLLSTMGALGVRISNIYFIGKRRYEIGEVFGTSIIIACCCSTILLGGFIVSSPWVFPMILKEVNPIFVWISITMVPFLIMSSYIGGMLLGLIKINSLNAATFMSGFVQLMLILILVVIGKFGVKGAVIAFMGETLFGLAILLTLILKYVGTKVTFRIKAVVEFIKFGVKGHIGNIFQYLNYRLDFFLLAYFTNSVEIGYYFIATAISEKLWLISGSVGTVLFPFVSSVEPESVKTFTSKVCRHTLFITILLGVILAVTSKLVILIIFGKAYLPSLQPLLILIPGVVMLSIAKVLNGDLAGRGRPELGSRSAGISLIINVSLNLILIPKWGISGAALSSTVSYTIVSLVMLYYYVKLSGSNPFDATIIQPNDFKLYISYLKRGKAWLSTIR